MKKCYIIPYLPYPHPSAFLSLVFELNNVVTVLYIFHLIHQLYHHNPHLCSVINFFCISPVSVCIYKSIWVQVPFPPPPFLQKRQYNLLALYFCHFPAYLGKLTTSVPPEQCLIYFYSCVAFQHTLIYLTSPFPLMNIRLFPRVCHCRQCCMNNLVHVPFARCANLHCRVNFGKWDS